MALLIGFIYGKWFLEEDICCLFYTAKPIRLYLVRHVGQKKARGLGELAIFLTFGPLLTLGAYYAISSSTIELFSQGFYNAIQWLVFLNLVFLTTNILFINQFPDTNSDAKTGKNHLVVTFGKKIQDGDIFDSIICGFFRFLFNARNLSKQYY